MIDAAQMGEAIRAAMDMRGTTSARNIIVQLIGPDDQQRTAELYCPPGMAASPTGGDKTIAVPIGQGGRIVLAVHNYKIEVSAEPGETVLYSTDEAGESVATEGRFKTNGTVEITAGGEMQSLTVNARTIEIGGEIEAVRDRTLVTHEELKTALEGLVGDINERLNTLKDALENHKHTAQIREGAPVPPVTADILDKGDNPLVINLQDVALDISDSSTEFITTAKTE